MKKYAASAFVTALVALLVSTAAAQQPRPFAHPDRIRYDGNCLTIDGKDTFIFSGAFHYFRCPKELWRDRFTKLKEAGFNAVETYIPWNVHEVQMPADVADFSKVDLKDADDWMTMAESFGFYIIIRPGPYICAEWERGGYPGWLINKRPAELKEPLWFRSDNPEFLAWSKHWMDAVCPVVAKHQITQKPAGSPGVILFQLENEYDYAQFSKEVRSAYVKSLAQDAVADGIDVPLFTCWTREMRDHADPVLFNVMDSCNFYPRWNVESTLRDVASLRAGQPDAPLMTTELQGGWFTNGLGEPPIHPEKDAYEADLGPTQINNLTLLMWAHGETVTNYYMAFGGTNFGDTAAQNISTSYDYNAPIRECGGVGEKYLRVKALGEFVKVHGAGLARSKAVEAEVSTGSPDVSVIERRSVDGARYLFVRTNQHDVARQGTAHVKEKGGAELAFAYDLEPFGSRVLYLPGNQPDAAKGEWWPKAVSGPARPTNVPGSQKISDIQAVNGVPQLEWKDSDTHSLNELGIYDSRFVFYRTTVTVGADELKAAGVGGGAVDLAVDHPEGDAVVAVVNGQKVPTVANSGDHLFALGAALHEGENAVMLLYENIGIPNGGEGMEKRDGISGVRLVPAAQEAGAIDGWRMKILAANAPAEPLPEVAAEVDASGWKSVRVRGQAAAQLKQNQTAVFRATFAVSADDVKSGRTSLRLLRVDDGGEVFVNGSKIGEAQDWSHTYTFDAAKQLHVGKNSIAVLVHNADGNGGLGAVTLALPQEVTIGKTGTLAYADVSPEAAAEASLPEGMLPSDEKQGSGLMTTERLSFEIPASPENVWVPWLLRVQATGNGFLYVNGHPLGRYWQAGKQKDFFLPECWLNAGAGKKNIVSMELSEVDQPVAVQSAEVIPYSVYAEKR